MRVQLEKSTTSASHQAKADFWTIFFIAWYPAVVSLGLIAAFDLKSPLDYQREMLLAFLFVAHMPMLIASVWWYFRVNRSELARIPSPRGGLGAVLWRMRGYVPVSFVLVATFGSSWTMADIGWAVNLPWLWSVLAGLAMYAVYFCLQWGLEVWNPERTAAKRNAFQKQVIRMHLPRGRWAQALSLLDLTIFGPIWEEVIYRGFLVFMLARVCESLAVGIVSGLALFWLLHVYQGPEQQFTQLRWIALSLLLMFSPAGLLGVIVMHVAHNVYCRVGIAQLIRRKMAVFASARQAKIGQLATEP